MEALFKHEMAMYREFTEVDELVHTAASEKAAMVEEERKSKSWISYSIHSFTKQTVFTYC